VERHSCTKYECAEVHFATKEGLQKHTKRHEKKHEKRKRQGAQVGEVIADILRQCNENGEEPPPPPSAEWWAAEMAARIEKRERLRGAASARPWALLRFTSSPAEELFDRGLKRTIRRLQSDLAAAQSLYFRK
jgi:hypothetical protein